ncbi:unnamed protein product [Cylindrotheca closterium]|uniref:Carboxylesterase type B domain-containing protein n=1 Tax=Cylindrotheca closterium TaxID=2856 RepID=A0AAD2G763_9STRA|nr:unnamed protein product [Cylindrotheca closterium]
MPKRTLPKGASCSSDAGVCSWKAVPYAEPMNKRFAPSKPLKSLDVLESPRYASQQRLNDGYGPMCFQWFPGLSEKYDVSEDCLTLNIWTPYCEATPENEDLKPVILWIHGGSFLEGGGATHWSAYGLPGSDTIKLYDGTNLVRAASNMTSMKEILVVSAQYRLGPFGFLAQPPGGNTTTGGANGFGDIVTALQWMKKHISDFGGNPNKITLMGEGSGSVTACALLHSPVTKGLFHRVILQSGNCYPSIDYLLPPQDAWNVRERFLEMICPADPDIAKDHDCEKYADAQDFLLHAPADEILNRTLNGYHQGSVATGWIPMYMDGLGSPSVDGYILPKLPIHLTPHPGVEVMVGVTSNDKVPAGLKRPSRLAEHAYATLQIENLRKAYHDFEDEDDADLFLDACIRCQSQQVLKRVAETGSSAFWYKFDCPKDAAPHGSTSMAVLGNIDPVAFESDVVKYLVGPPPSEELIHRMQKAWISFATTGNPGWEEASNKGMGALIFCQETTIEPLIDKFGRCDNWTEWADTHGPQSTGSICMRESSMLSSQQTEASKSTTGLRVLSRQTMPILPTSIVLILFLVCRYIVIRRRLGYATLP